METKGRYTPSEIDCEPRSAVAQAESHLFMYQYMQQPDAINMGEGSFQRTNLPNKQLVAITTEKNGIRRTLTGIIGLFFYPKTDAINIAFVNNGVTSFAKFPGGSYRIFLTWLKTTQE